MEEKFSQEETDQIMEEVRDSLHALAMIDLGRSADLLEQACEERDKRHGPCLINIAAEARFRVHCAMN